MRRRPRPVWQGPLLPGARAVDRRPPTAWPWLLGAGAFGAVLVGLPAVLARDDAPHEWAGMVLLLHTLTVAATVLAVGLVLLLLGRGSRPRVAATGAGLLVSPLLVEVVRGLAP